MIRHRPLNEVVEDLRFALKVMEENSHSGLSHEAARVLRNRILSQISALEDQIAREPAADEADEPLTLELVE
jgi:hypothetical protein